MHPGPGSRGRRNAQSGVERGKPEAYNLGGRRSLAAVPWRIAMEWFWLALIFLGVFGFTYTLLIMRRDYSGPR